jgi:hypothetical protein
MVITEFDAGNPEATIAPVRHPITGENVRIEEGSAGQAHRWWKMRLAGRPRVLQVL